MRRVAILLAVVVLPVMALRAQEPPEKHLEFIRNLRGKGYAD